MGVGCARAGIGSDESQRVAAFNKRSASLRSAISVTCNAHPSYGTEHRLLYGVTVTVALTVLLVVAKASAPHHAWKVT